MKGKFTAVLLDILNDLPGITAGFLVRESLEYKMMRAGGMNPRKVYQGFYNLKKRQILKTNPQGFAFTPKGRDWFLDLKFKQLRLSRKKWDKKWRIVIFDIPEQFKHARRIFRSKLKVLGFRMVQKSVFICPFPCEKEINFLSQYLKIIPYVDVITAISAGDKEEEFKKYYEI